MGLSTKKNTNKGKGKGKKRINSKKSHQKKRITNKNSKKSKKQKGGSVTKYMVMGCLCNTCGVPTPIKGFPNGHQAGGSAYLMVHNSMDASRIPYAQLTKCMLKSPMFN